MRFGWQIDPLNGTVASYPGRDSVAAERKQRNPDHGVNGLHSSNTAYAGSDAPNRRLRRALSASKASTDMHAEGSGVTNGAPSLNLNSAASPPPSVTSHNFRPVGWSIGTLMFTTL